EVMRATIESPESLALLDGDLLEDLDGLDAAFDLWLTTERERLRDSGRTLGESLLRAQIEPERAIAAAQRLLQIDRAHEGAWRALMRAHATRGERGMAIQAYDRCRAVLADMMDAAPSAETQKLLAEIRGPSGSRMPLRPPAPPPPEAEPAPETVSRMPGPAYGGAHIGVMPLTLVGAAAHDADLAQGVAEEITATLSHIRWLFIVSPASLALYAEERRDDAAIRRTFGLDFLLDGTIQRVSGRVRVSLRLLDLRNLGQVAWARRFDRDDSDPLSLQDDIAAEVAAQVDSEILMIEARRASSMPADRATPYDLMLRALPLMQRMEHAPFMAAGVHLRRAVEAAPDLASAHAWQAHWLELLITQGWAMDTDVSAREAAALADRAIRLDPFDARALTLAAEVCCQMQHALHEAASLHDRALSLNPNLALAWAMSAYTHAYLGESGEAERRAARYKTLSPLHPWAFALDGVFALIALLKRDFESAARAGRTAAQMNLGWTGGLPAYLAALGHLNRGREAAAVRARLLSTHRSFRIETYLGAVPLERPQDRDLLREGLERAGLPL
ncbi:MAG: BTAD domain-containing putative transcriptional regulator, partial [Acetobacteraceae bacterium]